MFWGDGAGEVGVWGEGRNLRTHTRTRAVNESLLIDWEKPLLLCELKCPKCLAMQQASFHKKSTYR